jgi:hypothetical protein
MSDITFKLCGYKMIEGPYGTLHDKAKRAPFLSGIEILLHSFAHFEGKIHKLPSGKELPMIKLRLSVGFFGFGEDGESELPVFSDIKDHFGGKASDLSFQKIAPFLVFLKNVNSDEDLDGYNILDPSNHSDNPRECIVKQRSGNVVYCFYYLPPLSDKLLSFAKGFHPRLGEDSHLQILDIDIINQIGTQALSYINDNYQNVNKGYDDIRKCCATVVTLTGNRLLTVADGELTNRQIYAKTRQELKRIASPGHLNKFRLVTAAGPRPPPGAAGGRAGGPPPAREIPRDDNLFQIPRSGNNSIALIFKIPRKGQGREHLESADILIEDGIIPEYVSQAVDPDEYGPYLPKSESEKSDETIAMHGFGGGRFKSKKKSKIKYKRKSKRRKSKSKRRRRRSR